MQSILFTNQDIQKAQMFDNYNIVKQQMPSIIGNDSLEKTEFTNSLAASLNQQQSNNVGPGTTQQVHVNANLKKQIDRVNKHTELYIEGINNAGPQIVKAGYQTAYGNGFKTAQNPKAQTFGREDSPLLKMKMQVIQNEANATLNDTAQSSLTHTQIQNQTQGNKADQYDNSLYKGTNYIIKMSTKSALKNQTHQLRGSKFGQNKAQSLNRQSMQSINERKLNSSQRDYRDEFNQYRRTQLSKEEINRAQTILPDMSYYNSISLKTGQNLEGNQTKYSSSFLESQSRYKNNLNEHAKNIIKKISQNNQNSDTIEQVADASQNCRKSSYEPTTRYHKNVHSSQTSQRRRGLNMINPNLALSNDAMITPMNRSHMDFHSQGAQFFSNQKSNLSVFKNIDDLKQELVEYKNRTITLEQELLNSKEEIERMKEINKELLNQLSLYQVGDQNLNASLKQTQQNNDVTKIHQLYQDLYLTDLKKDLNVVEYELKNQKCMYNEKLRDTTSLKKEIIQYQCSLKRYRKMVQELQTKLSKLNSQGQSQMLRKETLQQLSEDLPLQPSFDNTSQASFQLDTKRPSFMNYMQQPTIKDGSPKNKTSFMSKPAVNVNLMDLSKVEKLQALFQNLLKQKKVFKAFISVLFDLKSVVNCSIVTMFLFDSKISDHHIKDYVFMQKTMIDGRWVDRIGVNEKDVSEAAFKKFEDLNKIIRTQEYLAFPVFNRNGDLIAGIQIEARRKQSTGKHMGFYLLDELIMKIVISTFQMKLDKLIAEDLFRQMKATLPEFFDFESIGILLRDLKSQELFTIAESFENLGQEENGDEFKNTTIIRFPSSLGVTGFVYNTGELYICNKATKDSKFSSDIDNLGATGDVHNFMIGPIYGHKDNDNKKLPIGVLQFTNKKDFKIINDYDKKKFYAIQNLIGLSIDNTSEIHSTINVTMGIRDIFINLERLLTDSFSDDKTLDSAIDTKFELIIQAIQKMVEIKKQIQFF
eukprot:403377247